MSCNKCDSQDFYMSNCTQNKLVYSASLAYGMEIPSQSLCSILNWLSVLKGNSPFAIELNELNC